MSITLRSRRGAIGSSWWAVALRGALEAILGVGRASGGKADARSGKVQWIDLDTGVVRGAVLDARGDVHEARLDLPAFAAADHEAFLRIARARPELPARFSAGEYPEEFERELARAELSLLPRGAAELSHDCTCLDWPGPCRHVAALAYVLVEAVDEQPLQLLSLRGVDLAELVPAAAPPPEAEAEDAAAGTVTPDETPRRPESGEVDPTKLDPAPLAAVVGEEAAALLAAFFAAADPSSPSPTTERE